MSGVDLTALLRPIAEEHGARVDIASDATYCRMWLDQGCHVTLRGKPPCEVTICVDFRHDGALGLYQRAKGLADAVVAKLANAAAKLPPPPRWHRMTALRNNWSHASTGTVVKFSDGDLKVTTPNFPLTAGAAESLLDDLTALVAWLRKGGGA